MGKRHASRAIALKLLYACDLNSEDSVDVTTRFFQYHTVKEDIRRFAVELFDGVLHNREDIDAVIQKNSPKWDLHRIGAIDRNILRISAYEMLIRNDIPAAVSIDEAIELAKQYGSDTSPSFVNGILDEIRKRLVKDDVTG